MAYLETIRSKAFRKIFCKSRCRKNGDQNALDSINYNNNKKQSFSLVHCVEAKNFYVFTHNVFAFVFG